MHAQTTSCKTGVWIIGALGDIATTMIAGTLAIRHGLAGRIGLVSDLDPLDRLDLAPLETLVFGGIDIHGHNSGEPIARTIRAARAVAEQSRTLSPALLETIAPELERIDRDICSSPDFHWKSQGPVDTVPMLPEVIEQLRAHIRSFKARHDLDCVVAINLASPEALPLPSSAWETLGAFEAALATNDRRVISPSLAAAYAALQEGCPYLNFTPNLGASIPALKQLALQNQLPFYGNDAKTGETLLKTVLAPMFAKRHLHIMSWEGINLLGNGDGKALAEPDRRESKLRNKSEILEKLMGYPLHSGVNINYVPSLGDWKNAWDLIHFKGFLDVPMTMQFTWQCYDSILAAPLALDMIRLAEFAVRHDEAGPMKHLASFFKNPLEVEELAFFPQFDDLLRYARDHLARQETLGEVTQARGA